MLVDTVHLRCAHLAFDARLYHTRRRSQDLVLALGCVAAKIQTGLEVRSRTTLHQPCVPIDEYDILHLQAE